MLGEMYEEASTPTSEQERAYDKAVELVRNLSAPK
jgi:hypothetical protein